MVKIGPVVSELIRYKQINKNVLPLYDISIDIVGELFFNLFTATSKNKKRALSAKLRIHHTYKIVVSRYGIILMLFGAGGTKIWNFY